MHARHLEMLLAPLKKKSLEKPNFHLIEKVCPESKSNETGLFCHSFCISLEHCIAYHWSWCQSCSLKAVMDVAKLHINPFIFDMFNVQLLN